MKALAASVALALFGGNAVAQTTLSFRCINGESDVVCETGATQLVVDVTLVNSDACFSFRNAGPDPSSIARIYFDDDSGILSNAVIVNGPGVLIADVRTPGPLNLPGGNTVDFEATSRYVAVQPPPHNGVNPGEHTRICFDVPAGTTIRDLRLLLASGEIRIGMHVIAFENSESGSFINDPVCLADYNEDGVVNSSDYFDFIIDFF